MSRVYTQKKRPGAKAAEPSYRAPAVHAPSLVSGQSSSDLDALMQAKYRQHFMDNQIPTAEAEADRIAASVSGARTPEEVKTQLGEKMGADFSNVTFHTDSAALKQADAMGARAYTAGSDVYFGSGGFDPGVAAHELVHTVQQGMVGSTMGTTSAPTGGVQMKPKKKLPQRSAAQTYADHFLGLKGEALYDEVNKLRVHLNNYRDTDHLFPSSQLQLEGERYNPKELEEAYKLILSRAVHDRRFMIVAENIAKQHRNQFSEDLGVIQGDADRETDKIKDSDHEYQNWYKKRDFIQRQFYESHLDAVIKERWDNAQRTMNPFKGTLADYKADNERDIRTEFEKHTQENIAKRTEEDIKKYTLFNAMTAPRKRSPQQADQSAPEEYTGEQSLDNYRTSNRILQDVLRLIKPESDAAEPEAGSPAAHNKEWHKDYRARYAESGANSQIDSLNNVEKTFKQNMPQKHAEQWHKAQIAARKEYLLPTSKEDAIQDFYHPKEQKTSSFQQWKIDRSLRKYRKKQEKAAQKEKDRHAFARYYAREARTKMINKGVMPTQPDYEKMSTQEIQELTALYSRLNKQLSRKHKKNDPNNIVLSPQDYDKLNPIGIIQHIERGPEIAPDTAPAPAKKGILQRIKDAWRNRKSKS